MSVTDAIRALDLLQRRVQSSPAGGRREWSLRQLDLLRSALAPVSGHLAAWSWDASASVGDVRGERIEPNGLGGMDTVSQQLMGLDATRNAFDPARQGVPLGGAGVMLQPTAVLGNTHVAVLAEPLIASPLARSDSGAWLPAMHRAYVRAVARNVAVRVGADELRWGQSPTGSLFISGNAAPLHAVTVGTDTPVTLPWLLRFAGPFRLTGMLADLGLPSRGPRHPRLAGWQGSIEPWSRFELGVAVLTETGGSGAPGATFLERVVDLFPVIDALTPSHSDIQISNKLAGGNLRLRLPAGVDFYYELQIDDFDARRLRSSLVQDAGHLLGLRAPILVAARPLTLRAEWQRTSLRLYEHTQFPAGVTFHNRLIGNPLGPNAKGAYLSGRYDLSPTSFVSLSLGDERRNPTIFSTTVSSALDRGFRFVVDTLKPDHRRELAVATFEREVGSSTALLNLGAARMWQDGAGRARTEWSFEIGVRRDLVRGF